MNLKYLFPPTPQRVPFHTSKYDNLKIRQQTLYDLDDYIDADNNSISQRLAELNFEWDTERILETKAASFLLVGSTIGLIKCKSCAYLLTGTIGLILLQHALQGWSPLLPLIRKFSIRTEQEINNEKTVLKILRGDFKTDTTDVLELLKAVEKQ